MWGLTRRYQIDRRDQLFFQWNCFLILETLDFFSVFGLQYFLLQIFSPLNPVFRRHRRQMKHLHDYRRINSTRSPPPPSTTVEARARLVFTSTKCQRVAISEPDRSFRFSPWDCPIHNDNGRSGIPLVSVAIPRLAKWSFMGAIVVFRNSPCRNIVYRAWCWRFGLIT